MSVPKGQRDEGKLKVLTKANALMRYTIQIATNEKNFPKRYRWCITNRIVNTTADIVDKIIHANAIFVQTDDDIERRLRLINEAIELTYVLLNQIQLAYQTFKIDSHRISYWTGEIIELQTLLRNWKKWQPL